MGRDIVDSQISPHMDLSRSGLMSLSHEESFFRLIHTNSD